MENDRETTTPCPRLEGLLLRLGHCGSVGAITAVSVLLSLVLTLLLQGLLGLPFLPKILFVAIAVPALVAPCLSSPLLLLLFSLENARRKMRVLATTDELTGAYNRRHFMRIAQREFERARFGRRPLGLMILDMDHFKTINDTHGHNCGDLALRTIGQTCMGSVRPSDLFARYGGEEFVLLVPGTEPEQARAIAERIRSRIERLTIDCADKRLHLTVSIGLSNLCNGQPPTLDALLSHADAALYRAKAKGRNRVEVG